ncbi:unnamed protein product [Agarophyton chilense]
MQIQRLVFVITFAGSLAFDFCHSDPRIQVYEDRPQSTSSQSCPTAIYLPVLDRNPNHALHDRLWALSHYLQHCTDTRSTLVLNDHLLYNLSLCKAEDTSPNSKRPTWGTCLAFILSQRHDMLLYFSPSRIWPDKVFKMPDSCYSRHIWLGVQPSATDTNDLGVRVSHFRKFSWFGRNCEEQMPCLGGLGPLPESLQMSALSNIVSAVQAFLEIEFIPQDAVNILVYDRSDTFRRRWNGAKDVYDKLKFDTRINVQLIHRMPGSFSKQVRLFAWANIVLAPHGGAMANTIFMQSGGDILEMRRNCEADTRFANFMPWDWTGWHAHLLGLNLIYIGCTTEKQKTEIPNGIEQDKTKFTVNVTEVLRVIEGCIRRQIHRRDVAKRSRSLSEKSSEDEDEEMLYLVHKEFQNITMIEFLFLVSITSVIIIGSKLCSRRRQITRRT